MFMIDSYFWAVICCFITMLCWGSWANTQKLAGKEWRFELFYWDYVIGVLLLSVIMAFTLGSSGVQGRPFLEDIAQADSGHIVSALLGGAIFNAANILLVAAIAIAGMAVAFPVGIGLALVVGVVVNYLANPLGNPTLLFGGVLLVAAAIVLDAAAYRSLPDQGKGVSAKGLVLAILCGILMGFFYRFVASAMSTNFETLESGKLSPYTAVFFFALGLFLSNFVFNTWIMKKPFVDSPVAIGEYFKGSLKIHSIGILGGLIWGLGMMLSILASGQAGFAISYGLGQGATMVAAIWGVFIWKEFAGASKKVNQMLVLMFLCYLVGLVLIIASRLV
jgi:glucose uptake protein